MKKKGEIAGDCIRKPGSGEGRSNGQAPRDAGSREGRSDERSLLRMSRQTEKEFEDRNRAEGCRSSSTRWKEFLDALMRDRPNLVSFLSLAAVAGSTASHIDLVYPQNMTFQFKEITEKAGQGRDYPVLERLHRQAGRIPCYARSKIGGSTPLTIILIRSAEARSIENEIKQRADYPGSDRFVRR